MSTTSLRAVALGLHATAGKLPTISCMAMVAAVETAGVLRGVTAPVKRGSGWAGVTKATPAA